MSYSHVRSIFLTDSILERRDPERVAISGSLDKPLTVQGL